MVTFTESVTLLSRASLSLFRTISVETASVQNSAHLIDTVNVSNEPNGEYEDDNDGYHQYFLKLALLKF